MATNYRTRHTNQRAFAPGRIAAVAALAGLSDSFRRFVDTNHAVAATIADLKRAKPGRAEAEAVDRALFALQWRLDRAGYPGALEDLRQAIAAAVAAGLHLDLRSNVAALPARLANNTRKPHCRFRLITEREGVCVFNQWTEPMFRADHDALGAAWAEAWQAVNAGDDPSREVQS